LVLAFLAWQAYVVTKVQHILVMRGYLIRIALDEDLTYNQVRYNLLRNLDMQLAGNPDRGARYAEVSHLTKWKTERR